VDAAFLGFLAALLATGAMRLGEVWVSVRRMRARPDQVVAEPALFPAMVALHVGLVALPLAEAVLLDRVFVPAVALPSAAVLVVATALRVWTLSTLGRVWNVRIVRPPPAGVVTTGPYRFVRHPNYLCVVLEIAALPLLHTAWVSAVALSLWNAAVLVVRIRNEEAELVKIDAWRRAFAGKARLVPWLV
jgi:methyltransferase